jgi:hypothetical protein
MRPTMTIAICEAALHWATMRRAWRPHLSREEARSAARCPQGPTRSEKGTLARRKSWIMVGRHRIAFCAVFATLAAVLARDLLGAYFPSALEDAATRHLVLIVALAAGSWTAWRATHTSERRLTGAGPAGSDGA